MARGELLRKLFHSYANTDDHAFRAVALQLIAEEQQKQNHALARDLLNMIENRPSKPASVPSAELAPPKDRERLSPLVDVRTPIRAGSDIILSERTRAQVNRIIGEYNKAEVLRTHGLRPMNKLLFCGPPGCGKTLCSEIIATELHIPLLYSRFDAIVSSYLGETSGNLRKIFDYASTNTWVVLFDEFDAIGKDRNDPTEHGELKRVVNTFLQLLDGFQGNSIIIAATNHQRSLDPALWRRFDEVIAFDKPGIEAIKALLKLKLRNFPQKGTKLDKLAPKLKGLSHSDVEWVCLDAIKTSILDERGAITQDLLEASLERQRERHKIRTRAHKVTIKG